MTTTKKRGRPPGSSRKNEGDYRLLEQVAERMVREPSLKPTTAMKALGVMGDADQRRLRDKWAVKSDDYLHAAQSRLDAEREATALAFRFRLKEDALKASQSLQQLALAAHERFQQWRHDNPYALEQLAAVGRTVSAWQRQQQPTALELVSNPPLSALERAMREQESWASHQLKLTTGKR